MNYSIDINCDLGEGIGNDALLMPFLSSCNIACGVHAGSLEIIKETLSLAIQCKTKIGAHPSFPDRENFGRTEMNLPSKQLTELIIDQILLVAKLAQEAGVKLNHVKPHGALYNMAAVNQNTAEAVLKAIKTIDTQILLYAPFGSLIAKMATEQRIPIKYEAFADRNYNDDLTLVARKQSNAILHDPDQIFDHVMLMIKKQKVKTINGHSIHIEADTLCIHGDNPNAVDIASSLSENLQAANIRIE